MPSIINAPLSGGVTITSDTSGVLQLQTASTTALTITAAQNVGIGTASPAQKLTVNTAGVAGAMLRLTDGTQQSFDIESDVGAGGAGVISYNTVNGGQQAFKIAGTERMRITSTGLVGIGQTNPSAYNFNNLVIGTTSGNSGMTLASGTTGEGTIAFADGTTGTEGYRGFIQYQHTSDFFAFGTSATERMRITAAGDIGIGTTSVSSPSGFTKIVQIFDASSSTLVTSGGGRTAEFGCSAGGGWLSANGANPMRFGTDGSERMRIDSSGNVGIGTAAPLSASNRTVLTLQNNSWGGQLNIAVAGTTHAQFGTDNFSSGLSCRIESQDGIIFKCASATERMRIDSSGNVVIGGTVVCNNTANRGNITINGTSNSILNLTNGNNPSEGGYFYFDGTSIELQSSRASSVVRVRAQTNGVVLNNGATSWSSASDERVKDIIEPITDGLNKVASIRAVIGKYKTDEEGTRRSFLIAQDVQAVLPEAVVAQDDEIGTLSLSYTDTIPLLISAIQELKAELDSVKAELQTLKGN